MTVLTAHLVCKNIDIGIFNRRDSVIDPWKNPLPLEEYKNSEVVICSYSDRWIPIMFSPLADALTHYHKASLLGEEVFVFPSNLTPWVSKAFLHNLLN